MTDNQARITLTFGVQDGDSVCWNYGFVESIAFISHGNQDGAVLFYCKKNIKGEVYKI